MSDSGIIKSSASGLEVGISFVQKATAVYRRTNILRWNKAGLLEQQAINPDTGETAWLLIEKEI